MTKNIKNSTWTPKKIISSFLILVVLGLLVWGIQWATYARPPLPDALAALASDELVTVKNEPWLTFTPVEESPTTAFIYYPGGRVDPRAYAPLARTIAANGYLVVIPSMPINMAVFDANVADEIIEYFPEIEHWAIGGHSVGGTMAAQYTSKNPEKIAALAIWASYPADSADNSEHDIPVLSIYGGREEGVTDETVGERAHLLPKDTVYIRIEGGDHHQFGSYLIDSEDHLATISRESQHGQIIEATLALLEKITQ